MVNQKEVLLVWGEKHGGPSHGTNIAEAVAPVSLIASLTLAKTGFPRCVSPAFFGFVPPTTLVPALRQSNESI